MSKPLKTDCTQLGTIPSNWPAKISAYNLNASVTIPTKCMTTWIQLVQAKWSANKLGASVSITCIYPSMAHRISSVVVSILIWIIRSIRRLVRNVTVKLLPSVGPVLVGSSILTIRLFIRVRLRRRRRGRLLVLKMELWSVIAACSTGLKDLAMKSRRRSRRRASRHRSRSFRYQNNLSWRSRCQHSIWWRSQWPGWNDN